MKAIDLLLLFILALFTAKAAGATTILGAPSCGSWTKYRDEMHDAGPNFIADANLYWLNGFLSGSAKSTNILINKNGGDYDLLKGSNPNSRVLYVDNYCRQHPLSNLDEAATSLLGEMINKSNYGDRSGGLSP